jgi:uncharacterized protein YciI
MFVIQVNYIQSIDWVNKYLLEHRAFLDEGYKKNYFIVSGPKNPRTGGIILSQLTDRHQLETILKNDPFLVHGIAAYEVIEFSPVKYHSDFSSFIFEAK